jgi:hypothetical protein
MLLRNALTLSACLLLLTPAQAADVDALLGQMTLDEKLALLHGALLGHPGLMKLVASFM